MREPTPGLFPLQPEDKEIDEVVALDERSILIRWRGPYRLAGSLNYSPLPRHLLEAAFDQGDPTSFANHPYWATDYVQLGPFRILRWEPGAHVEAAAFPGYALGAPRIERLRLIWAADANVTVAYLLSGQAQIALDNALNLEAGSTLRREWPAQGGGSVVLSADQGRYLQVQFRPEYVRPAVLLDPRVRPTPTVPDTSAYADIHLWEWR